MSIDLPVIKPKLIIGTINPDTGEITVSSNFISYSCSFSTDCCGNIEFAVPVTDMDIERIEDHGYEIDQIVDTLSPEIRFAPDYTAEKNYWIKRKPFTGTCTFLEADKCSIHQFKPFACRIFPFQLLSTNGNGYKIAVHESNICKSVKSEYKKNAENLSILKTILHEVQQEEIRRKIYFERYGRD